MRRYISQILLIVGFSLSIIGCGEGDSGSDTPVLQQPSNPVIPTNPVVTDPDVTTPTVPDVETPEEVTTPELKSQGVFVDTVVYGLNVKQYDEDENLLTAPADVDGLPSYSFTDNRLVVSTGTERHNGKFSFIDNAYEVEFLLGDLSLGKINVGDNPVDGINLIDITRLFDTNYIYDSRVMYVSRLLLSLDTDPSDDVIDVTAYQSSSFPTDLDFTLRGALADRELQNTITGIDNTKSLVTEADAETHLEDTHAKLTKKIEIREATIEECPTGGIVKLYSVDFNNDNTYETYTSVFCATTTIQETISTFHIVGKIDIGSAGVPNIKYYNSAKNFSGDMSATPQYSGGNIDTAEVDNGLLYSTISQLRDVTDGTDLVNYPTVFPADTAKRAARVIEHWSCPEGGKIVTHYQYAIGETELGTTNPKKVGEYNETICSYPTRVVAFKTAIVDGTGNIDYGIVYKNEVDGSTTGTGTEDDVHTLITTVGGTAVNYADTTLDEGNQYCRGGGIERNYYDATATDVTRKDALERVFVCNTEPHGFTPGSHVVTKIELDGETAYKLGVPDATGTILCPGVGGYNLFHEADYDGNGIIKDEEKFDEVYCNAYDDTIDDVNFTVPATVKECPYGGERNITFFYKKDIPEAASVNALINATPLDRDAIIDLLDGGVAEHNISIVSCDDFNATEYNLTEAVETYEIGSDECPYGGGKKIATIIFAGDILENVTGFTDFTEVIADDPATTDVNEQVISINNASLSRFLTEKGLDKESGTPDDQAADGDLLRKTIDVQTSVYCNGADDISEITVRTPLGTPYKRDEYITCQDVNVSVFRLPVTGILTFADLTAYLSSPSNSAGYTLEQLEVNDFNTTDCVDATPKNPPKQVYVLNDTYKLLDPQLDMPECIDSEGNKLDANISIFNKTTDLPNSGFETSGYIFLLHSDLVVTDPVTGAVTNNSEFIQDTPQSILEDTTSTLTLDTIENEVKHVTVKIKNSGTAGDLHGKELLVVVQAQCSGEIQNYDYNVTVVELGDIHIPTVTDDDGEVVNARFFSVNNRDDDIANNIEDYHNYYCHGTERLGDLLTAEEYQMLASAGYDFQGFTGPYWANTPNGVITSIINTLEEGDDEGVHLNNGSQSSTNTIYAPENTISISFSDSDMLTLSSPTYNYTRNELDPVTSTYVDNPYTQSFSISSSNGLVLDPTDGIYVDKPSITPANIETNYPSSTSASVTGNFAVASTLHFAPTVSRNIFKLHEITGQAPASGSITINGYYLNNLTPVCSDTLSASGSYKIDNLGGCADKTLDSFTLTYTVTATAPFNGDDTNDDMETEVGDKLAEYKFTTIKVEKLPIDEQAISLPVAVNINGDGTSHLDEYPDENNLKFAAFKTDNTASCAVIPSYIILRSDDSHVMMDNPTSQSACENLGLASPDVDDLKSIYFSGQTEYDTTKSIENGEYWTDDEVTSLLGGYSGLEGDEVASTTTMFEMVSISDTHYSVQETDARNYKGVVCIGDPSVANSKITEIKGSILDTELDENSNDIPIGQAVINITKNGLPSVQMISSNEDDATKGTYSQDDLDLYAVYGYVVEITAGDYYKRTFVLDIENGELIDASTGSVVTITFDTTTGVLDFDEIRLIKRTVTLPDDGEDRIGDGSEDGFEEGTVGNGCESGSAVGPNCTYMGADYKVEYTAPTGAGNGSWTYTVTAKSGSAAVTEFTVGLTPITVEKSSVTSATTTSSLTFNLDDCDEVIWNEGVKAPINIDFGTTGSLQGTLPTPICKADITETNITVVDNAGNILVGIPVEVRYGSSATATATDISSLSVTNHKGIASGFIETSAVAFVVVNKLNDDADFVEYVDRIQLPEGSEKIERTITLNSLATDFEVCITEDDTNIYTIDIDEDGNPDSTTVFVKIAKQDGFSDTVETDATGCAVFENVPFGISYHVETTYRSKTKAITTDVDRNPDGASINFTEATGTGNTVKYGEAISDNVFDGSRYSLRLYYSPTDTSYQFNFDAQGSGVNMLKDVNITFNESMNGKIKTATKLSEDTYSSDGKTVSWNVAGGGNFEFNLIDTIDPDDFVANNINGTVGITVTFYTLLGEVYTAKIMSLSDSQ
jgi:hypothetical protein